MLTSLAKAAGRLQPSLLKQLTRPNGHLSQLLSQGSKKAAAMFPAPHRLSAGIWESWLIPLVILFLPQTILARKPASNTAARTQAVLQGRIPVAPLGYHAPGPLYMLSQLPLGSLDFIDQTHLLFTFHISELMRREPGSETQDAEMIRALVLDIPSGKVSSAATWRMADHKRYIWPLSEGRFLVRKGDMYSITDATLKMHTWLGSPTPIEATQVSPDGQLAVIESRQESQESKERQLQSADLDVALPAADTGVLLLNVDSKALLAAFKAEFPVLVPVTSSGYLAVSQEKDDLYLVRYVPFDGQPVTLGSVASTCSPRESFVSSKVFVIESCGPKSPDLYLDAWSIDGKNLWRGHRDGHNVLPVYASARNGSRFAVATLLADHYINLIDSLNREDVKEQDVQVMDTQTGRILMTIDASPIISAGQNFALSPDGSRLAVLRNGAIEIYAVPAPSHPSPK